MHTVASHEYPENASDKMQVRTAITAVASIQSNRENEFKHMYLTACSPQFQNGHRNMSRTKALGAPAIEALRQ